MLFLFLFSPCEILPQYFIDLDKIEQFKNSKEKRYDVGQDFKNADLKVYLKSVGSYNRNIEGDRSSNYISDVMVGFDKLQYSRGDTVVLTLKRGKENIKAEQEQIMINKYVRVKAIGFEMDTTQLHYVFYLKQNEGKKVFIYLSKNRDFENIVISLGGYAYETRSYIIPFPPLPGENSKETKPSVIIRKNHRSIKIYPSDKDTLK